MSDKFKVKMTNGELSLFTPDNEPINCEIVSIQRQIDIGPTIRIPGINPIRVDTVIGFSVPIPPFEFNMDGGQLFLVCGEKKYSVNDIEFSDGTMRVEVFAETEF